MESEVSDDEEMKQMEEYLEKEYIDREPDASAEPK